MDWKRWRGISWGCTAATGEDGLGPGRSDEPSWLKERRGLSQPYKGYIAKDKSRMFSDEISILLTHAKAIRDVCVNIYMYI